MAVLLEEELPGEGGLDPTAVLSADGSARIELDDENLTTLSLTRADVGKVLRGLSTCSPDPRGQWVELT